MKVRSKRFALQLEDISLTSHHSPLNNSLFLPLSLLNESVAISVEQFIQVFDLLLQFFPLVGVGNEHPAVCHFHDLDGALDVGTS